MNCKVDNCSLTSKEITMYNSRNTVYELWHPEHGLISGTKKELSAIYPELGTNLISLLSGKSKPRYSVHGWRLAKNKDLVITNGVTPKKHKYYHPNIGEMECTSKELWENYLKDKGYSKERATAIASGKEKTVDGWRLSSNKDYKPTTEEKYNLFHPEHGRHSLTRREFLDTYGGTRQGLSLLLLGKLQTYLGWKVDN